MNKWKEIKDMWDDTNKDIYQKIYDFFGIRNCEYVFGEVFNDLITELKRDIPERYIGETDEYYRNRVLEYMKQKEDLK